MTLKTEAESEHREKAPNIPLQDNEDRLDEHIHDDHGDPHQAALEDVDPNAKVSKSTWAAVFFLGFTFQPSLSFTILCVFPILVPIALELQGTTQNVNWMASGWSLAGSVSFAIAGQLSDYFGRRYILLFGQSLLIIGQTTPAKKRTSLSLSKISPTRTYTNVHPTLSIVGATAKTVNQGIGAMVLLGFGTGTTFVLYPGISELLPNKQRSIGLAWTELNILPFTTFGPLIARALLQNATWRWVFYLGIISGVISLVGSFIFYNPPSKPLRNITRRQLLGEIDYLGIFLYSSGLTLFLLGLGWGGISYPWKSAAVLAPIVIGALLFTSTFVWDFSGKPKRPLFPYRLFSNFHEYTSLLVIIFVTGAVYFSLTSLIPQQITDMFTSDPIRAGLYNIPGGFAGAGGGTILGALIYKIKHIPYQLAVGIAIQTLFTALFAILTPNRVAAGLVFQFFANLPFAWITLLCYVTASLHVPQRDLGLALGLIGTFRFLGGAIGTTMFPAILSNKIASSIPLRVAEAVRPLGYPDISIPALVSALTSGNATTLATTPTQVVQAAMLGMRWGYSDGFRLTWLISIPFGIIAMAVAFFVRDPSLYFTKHTAVTMEKERLGGDGRHNAELFRESNVASKA
ncbi:fungal trichothecene efflux pump-domain-containing protein [Lophiotrema nucula]|uniref:Fungal trichothecene efflux pump-domain-containing protein n=1 Tax=Lophiotrema nucula TaxID=690887 RepID=A0A6A5YVR1_9PLEO|nr:fungal trichothecene efflux pump-domain-containing protein [Lophiotrema nucula]